MPDFTFRVETTLGGRQAGVAELDRQGTREQLVPTQGQPPLCHLALAQHFMHHDLATGLMAGQQPCLSYRESHTEEVTPWLNEGWRS